MYLRKGGITGVTDPWFNRIEVKLREVEVLSFGPLKVEFDPRGLHDWAEEI